MQPHLAFTGYLGRRLHLGVCGSVAAYKALELLRMLTATGLGVGATLTASAERFVTRLSFEALGAGPVYGPMFDPGHGPFGHLEPGQSAHAMLVAPASANTLARLALGLADEMLACQALAFEGPLVVAPAMNPRLWNAPATRANWETLKARGVVCVEPACGDMACGEQGRGRLAPLEEIYVQALRAATVQDLAGIDVLLTLGPTRESFDCVRHWSNPSTGTMGAALAVAAWLRGARVHAVCGPVALWLPQGIERVDVTSAREMHQAAMDLFPAAQWACCTAAVADFRPEPFGPGKFKKDSGPLAVTFLPNPDILAAMGQARGPGQRLCGFAAEAADLEAHARGKLARKRLDLIVANDVTAPGSGFAAPTNGVLVLDAQGRLERWPVLPKTEVAWRIWDWMLALSS
ncbi:bifunctional phosphopantothenoylcysteine decarboxylase/phosphopantothenate--cysteine ligase CoaBC [Desulfocurvus vexinensis]|uniref:bifunctional phosphopantothenoylcysteine decarboxylase/phosphopantothenate--cysteine ligase CoaBC n=1 Tax=Desulfocurvus vexinensis TaxID=399548 RepID=UPI00048EAA9A|nr:bifunctional phosphopantothenoylcysteine decarboxylase/phosphopantothenate--cysteine ligase CoaBC [Desulfocurvus vexinensis]